VDEEALGHLADADIPVRDALEALCSRCFLVNGADGRRFVHPYLRQVIYTAIPAGIRGELHSRLAHYLDERSTSPVVLAHHYWHSDQAREEALPELIAAGEWALSVLEEEGAIQAFRHALRLLGRPAQEQAEPELRAAWMRSVFGLVTALARSGERDEAKLLRSSAVDEAAQAGWHAEAARLEVTAIV
jgi:predicted ATPase